MYKKYTIIGHIQRTISILTFLTMHGETSYTRNSKYLYYRCNKIRSIFCELVTIASIFTVSTMGNFQVIPYNYHHSHTAAHHPSE